MNPRGPGDQNGSSRPAATSAGRSRSRCVQPGSARRTSVLFPHCREPRRSTAGNILRRAGGVGLVLGMCRIPHNFAPILQNCEVFEEGEIAWRAWKPALELPCCQAATARLGRDGPRAGVAESGRAEPQDPHARRLLASLEWKSRDRTHVRGRREKRAATALAPTPAGVLRLETAAAAAARRGTRSPPGPPCDERALSGRVNRAIRPRARGLASRSLDRSGVWRPSDRNRPEAPARARRRRQSTWPAGERYRP